MELFSASGIDLPLAGASSRRGPATLARSLRVPLPSEAWHEADFAA